MGSYILSTERLGLRRWIKSDKEPFAELNKDPAVMKYFPRTLTDLESYETIKRINLHFEKNNFGLFAVDNLQTGQFIGFTGFIIPKFETFFTPCVEISWRFKKESWGKGFATEAAKVCLQYGFENLKFETIVSYTSALNLKSENVMRKIGMEFITVFDHPQIEKDNTLCRHVLYQIIRGI